MRTRHRMPMIFSLSMMDVFCCTLGCVILLWLINQREAMLRTRSAQEALEQLTGAADHVPAKTMQPAPFVKILQHATNVAPLWFVAFGTLWKLAASLCWCSLPYRVS